MIFRFCSVCLGVNEPCRYKKMFGEYAIYCDNKLYIDPTKTALTLLSEATIHSL